MVTEDYRSTTGVLRERYGKDRVDSRTLTNENERARTLAANRQPTNFVVSRWRRLACMYERLKSGGW
jgi:hypothetical protein